ncbi:MAG: hypothetical protein AB8H03_22955 [Saprospiraceae bacterium]
MTSVQFKNKINDFWNWFVEHEEKFRIITDPHAAREMLDNQILQFGVFAWEIGVGQRKPHTLTISPNGNSKMLRRSQAIIGEAPDLKYWEFFAAKPARDWDFTLEMYDSFMVKQKIDTADWEYLFRMTPDFKIRILLYAENIDFLDDDDKKSASDFVVNSIIGEADKIDYVDSIEFISFVNETQEDDIKSLLEMKFEFEQLLEKM